MINYFLNYFLFTHSIFLAKTITDKTFQKI
ncbi:hypothetical protein P872_20510 [Rhodonellum psychrophilum GCM71 = DSM 17998]|uniref:Uncharacterized protein n=2 Tax=Rhodonellum TaxID=336827 RepID=U5BTC1_9BACT|nr:hypothetical protein P872_20510 [Rhodonellum psychrophilum GCM71 = DSM 17998]SDZ20730.1 hypothetical protein SAMN05444412_107195 [Rhodonellum ikkaensis]